MSNKKSEEPQDAFPAISKGNFTANDKWPKFKITDNIKKTNESHPKVIDYNKKTNDMVQTQEKEDEKKVDDNLTKKSKKIQVSTKKYKPKTKQIEDDNSKESESMKNSKNKADKHSNTDSESSDNANKLKKDRVKNFDENKDDKNTIKRKTNNKYKNSKNKYEEEEYDEQIKKVPKDDKERNVLNSRSKTSNKANKYQKKSDDEENSDDSDQSIIKKRIINQKQYNDKSNRNKNKKIDDDDENEDNEVDCIHKQKKNEIKKKKIQNHCNDNEEEDDNDIDNHIYNQKKKDTKGKKAGKYEEEDEDDDGNAYKRAKKQKETKRKEKDKSDDDENIRKHKRNTNENIRKPPQKKSRNNDEEDEEDSNKYKYRKKTTKNSNKNDSEYDDDQEISNKKTRINSKNETKTKNSRIITHKTKQSDDNDDDEKPSKKCILKSNTKTRQKQPIKDTKQSKSNKKLTTTKKKIPETVTFTTFIELDMHGDDPRIKKVLDWVPIIRDALFDALERKVDFVRFITGQGKHSRNKVAVLRPLVLLTSKRLGFDSQLDIENAGVVVCDITLYKDEYPEEEEEETIDDEINKSNSELFRTFGVGDGNSKINLDDYRDLLKNQKKRGITKKKKNSDVNNNTDSDSDFDFDDFDSESDDDDENDIVDKNGLVYKKNVFKAIKKRYQYMPKVCIEIICTNRSKNEAIKFTRLFEMAIKKNDFEGNAKNSRRKMNIESSIVIQKRNKQAINEMKLVRFFSKEYCLDTGIIQRVVQETKNKKKATIIFNRIIKEVPNDFYVFLDELFTEYAVIPTKSILDTCQDENYEIENIAQRLISKSMAAMQNALGVLKVDNKIETKRKDGSPKFIPSIEIDLSNVGVQKAQITIERIMNALSNGNYSEMVLKFSKSSKTCKIEDVIDFVKHKARDECVHIRQKSEKIKNRYHFAIINDDHDIEDDLEEEDDIDDDDNNNDVVIEEEEEVNYSSENDD